MSDPTDVLSEFEFVMARIIEAEEEARRAQFNNGRWNLVGQQFAGSLVARSYGPDVVPERIGSIAWADNAHIARWDPAHVLAECKAKRKMLNLAWALLSLRVEPAVAAQLLHLLALPFADHPDYHEEWKP